MFIKKSDLGSNISLQLLFYGENKKYTQPKKLVIDKKNNFLVVLKLLVNVDI